MRIDDLVRTERYFTALLIHVLLSENLSGVDAFIDLLCERGILTDRPPGNASDDPRSQVVAELAATRDLLKGGYEFDDPESPPRDVVDVVIVALGILIAAEAKFFSPTSLSKVKGQLKTQGAPLEQFHTDPSFSVSRVCQVFLTADEGIRPDHVDGTLVLYWRDVAELAIKCKQTYVADRLERALQRYKVEFGGAAGPAGDRRNARPARRSRQPVLSTLRGEREHTAGGILRPVIPHIGPDAIADGWAVKSDGRVIDSYPGSKRGDGPVPPLPVVPPAVPARRRRRRRLDPSQRGGCRATPAERCRGS
jgi:hypothetical protein